MTRRKVAPIPNIPGYVQAQDRLADKTNYLQGLISTLLASADSIELIDAPKTFDLARELVEDIQSAQNALIASIDRYIATH